MNKIICGDALTELKKLPDESIDCCITSPPYWGLRDYGVSGQLGLEKTPEEYVENMVKVFREVKRVLKKEGTCWLNLGDSYATSNSNVGTGGIEDMGHNSLSSVVNQRRAGRVEGLKPKDLCGIPWRVAFALQADGWYLRQDIIWHKPNPMPESVTDRCTKSHEYIFLLAKSPHYYFDNEAIKEPSKINEHRPAGVAREREYGYDSKRNNNPEAYKIPWSKSGGKKSRQFEKENSPAGKWDNSDERYYPSDRNKRSVWTVTTKPFKEAHFATFPEALIEPMVKTTRPNAVILDPFFGAGTTGLVAQNLGRSYIGIELNPVYIKIAEKRLAQNILL